MGSKQHTDERKSSDLLEQLSQRVPGFIYQFQLMPDGSSCFPYASDGVREIYEVSPEEVRENAGPVFSRIHPDDLEGISLSIEQSATNLAPWREEYRVVLPERGLRWLQGDSVPERLEDGSVLWHGHIYDITDRKHVEQELLQVHERLRLATSAAGVGIWDMNLKTDNLIWDAYMHQLYGIPPEEFGGDYDTWLSAVHESDRDATHEELRKALESQQVYACSFRIRRPDGDVRNVEMHCLIQRDYEGVPERLVGINVDATDRIRTEEQLRQAQKMESVGQLAGGVAHDFNNILMAILGYAEMLQDDLTPEQESALEMVRQIEKGANRAAGLTRQLLTFSRRQPIEPRPLEFNALTEDLLKMIRRTLGEHVELTFEAGADAPNILADPGQIEQVIMNLCVNGRDAMPNGGKLTLKTSATYLEEDPNGTGANPGPFACLSVIDTGHGMDQDTIRQIFEPFFTTKELGRGTGLGLATVYAIVQQHNGTISVNSELGQGSAFHVYLPAYEADSNAVEVDHHEAEQGGTETILLAEDDEPLRLLATRILTKAGYVVKGVRDGNRALEAVEQIGDEVDLALLDVMMPGTNGYNVARSLRDRNPDLPILMMSGYNDVEPDTRLKVPLLKKPYSRAELLSTIRQLLDEKS
jgi:PAS domain S-box-containing protein